MLLFKNNKEEAVNVRQKDERGNYFWKWVEPSEEIDLPSDVGDSYGLENVEVKSFEADVGVTKVETKRVATKKKESKNVRKKK